MADDTAHAALKTTSGICRMDKPPSGPFAAWPPAPPAILKVDPTKLDTAQLARLTAVQGQYPNLSVGVIQFDAASSQPTLFGWQEHLECILGSMGKLAILYAAFQLREDVRTALKQSGVNPGNVDAQLRQMWSASCIPGLPVTPGKAPYLDRIFDIKPGSVEFKGFAGCGIPPDFTLPPDEDMQRFDKTHEMEHHIKEPDGTFGLNYMQRWARLLHHPFAQQLWLTTRWSDNAAATVCAAAIGLPYIFALMNRSKLYSATGAGEGLRLLRGYEDPPHWSEFSRLMQAHWSEFSRLMQDDMPVADWNAEAEGYRKFIEPFGDEDFSYKPEITRIGSGPAQAGTVIALASLMASLVQCNLFQPPSADPTHPARQMASFLRLTGPFGTGPSAGSYVVKALTGPDRVPIQYSDVWSKLGIDNDTFVDWAYMRGTRRLGFIVLNYKSTNFNKVTGEFLSPFDEISDPFIDCVRAIAAAL